MFYCRQAREFCRSVRWWVFVRISNTCMHVYKALKWSTRLMYLSIYLILSQLTIFSFRFFNIGSYHPYLETNLKYFEKAVRIMMAESSKASPLRFQNLEVSYDSKSPYIFLIGTMVDPAPSLGKETVLKCCLFLYMSVWPLLRKLCIKSKYYSGHLNVSL